MKEQIINIPDTIFLQLGFEPEEDETVDFKELEGVSWCAENIHGNDIEYIIKPKVDAAMKERDEEMIKFVEWVVRNYDKHSLGWIPEKDRYSSDSQKFSTAQLLEKFRALPPKEIT